MLNSLNEVVLGQQSLRNLRFLIELQLHTVSTSQDGSLEAQRAQADLRRLLNTEESLRMAQTAAPSRECAIAMA